MVDAEAALACTEGVDRLGGSNAQRSLFEDMQARMLSVTGTAVAA